MATQGGLPQGVTFTEEERKAAEDVIKRQNGTHPLQNAYAAAAVGYRYGDHQNRAMVSDRQERLSLR